MQTFGGNGDDNRRSRPSPFTSPSPLPLSNRTVSNIYTRTGFTYDISDVSLPLDSSKKCHCRHCNRSNHPRFDVHFQGFFQGLIGVNKKRKLLREFQYLLFFAPRLCKILAVIRACPPRDGAICSKHTHFGSLEEG